MGQIADNKMADLYPVISVLILNMRQLNKRQIFRLDTKKQVPTKWYL